MKSYYLGSSVLKYFKRRGIPFCRLNFLDDIARAIYMANCKYDGHLLSSMKEDPQQINETAYNCDFHAFLHNLYYEKPQVYDNLQLNSLREKNLQYYAELSGVDNATIERFPRLVKSWYKIECSKPNNFISPDTILHLPGSLLDQTYMLEIKMGYNTDAMSDLTKLTFFRYAALHLREQQKKQHVTALGNPNFQMYIFCYVGLQLPSLIKKNLTDSLEQYQQFPWYKNVICFYLDKKCNIYCSTLKGILQGDKKIRRIKFFKKINK